jgi:hypothetical protein
MRFWPRKKQPPLRDAANVIADAVETAKDRAIADVVHELAEARHETRQTRANLELALMELGIAGAAFVHAVQQRFGDGGDE